MDLDARDRPAIQPAKVRGIPRHEYRTPHSRRPDPAGGRLRRGRADNTLFAFVMLENRD